MPELNGRPPFTIDPKIAGWPLWTLIDQKTTVMVECDACHHRAAWSPGYMAKAFAAYRGKSLWWFAGRLRCGRCRSNYVRLWGA